MNIYGFNYRFRGNYAKGTVEASNRSEAWRIVIMILGGHIHPKGSGHPRVHLSLQDHPFHKQIKTQKQVHGRPYSMADLELN